MAVEVSRWIAQALKVASRSTHPRHRLGALVLRGGHVVASACNTGRWHRCAERRALRPHGDWVGCTLLVVRLGGRCSKPCLGCQLAIKEAGIKEVFYVNEKGDLCSSLW